MQYSLPFKTFLEKWFRISFSNFPRQFWLLMAGSLISSTGSSMVWPFLSIYLRSRLNVSLTTVASLLTLSSIMGLLASFVAGPIADRYGRKGIMVTGLFAGTVYYFLMSQAHSLPAFALLIGSWGAFNTLYPVGANAMVADLIPMENRTDAYSMLRIVHNVGVAVGPMIGGFLIISSYNHTFYGASAAFAFFGSFTLLMVKETSPQRLTPQDKSGRGLNKVDSGFVGVLQDRPFIGFVLSFMVTTMAASLMFILLPVYAKENLGIPENHYSYIVTVNAAMVIFLQYLVTQVTKRYRPLPVLAVGAMFYALGVGSVALGRGFWYFVTSMVIMSTGELIMTPTATALTATLAPLEKRGRYMGIYSLVWPVGSGIGPIVGGLLNDHFSPVVTWYGGGLFGLLSALGFLALTTRFPSVGVVKAGSIENHPSEIPLSTSLN